MTKYKKCIRKLKHPDLIIQIQKPFVVSLFNNSRYGKNCFYQEASPFKSAALN